MILVTGVSGFVGSAVAARVIHEGSASVRGALRKLRQLPAGVEPVIVGDIGPNTNWTHALAGVDVVVHAAARVHVMYDLVSDPLAEFRRVNVEGTRTLAWQAAQAGVRRLVFVSSIKVNGEQTVLGRPFMADDRPAPIDPYGISKHEAEQALLQIAKETGIEIVIIRPVLVYGPGVKANFLSMMRWLEKGIPLPLGAIKNQRSLVALDNLVDLILTCTHHAAARGEIFLVSDGEDLSTPVLLRRMARALVTTAHLIPVPLPILDATVRLLGKGDFAHRLYGSLQVDIQKTRTLLNWNPVVTVDSALQHTASHFLQSRSAR